MQNLTIGTKESDRPFTKNQTAAGDCNSPYTKTTANQLLI
jgi:hypothetical protein